MDEFDLVCFQYTQCLRCLDIDQCTHGVYKGYNEKNEFCNASEYGCENNLCKCQKKLIQGTWYIILFNFMPHLGLILMTSLAVGRSESPASRPPGQFVIPYKDMMNLSWSGVQLTRSLSANGGFERSENCLISDKPDQGNQCCGDYPSRYPFRLLELV